MNTKKAEKWKENWLSSINEWTSIDLQKKSWLNRNNTNSDGSLVEFMCSYLDELLIDQNYRYQLRKQYMTNTDFETIKDWHIALDKYNATNYKDSDHFPILNDPKWIELLKMGEFAKEKLSEILNEEQILNENFDCLKFI